MNNWKHDLFNIYDQVCSLLNILSTLKFESVFTLSKDIVLVAS